MRVLVACEESQAVCAAFRQRGHEAYSCDIQECSGGHPEWHILGDVMDWLGEGWDLIIAHPPCTYLSNLGAKHLYMGTERIKRQNDVFRLMNEDRIRAGIRARDFFFAMLNAPCSKVAVENPIPSSIWQLPPPHANDPALLFRRALQEKDLSVAAWFEALAGYRRGGAHRALGGRRAWQNDKNADLCLPRFQEKGEDLSRHCAGHG